jgi:hypothetical protein
MSSPLRVYAQRPEFGSNDYRRVYAQRPDGSNGYPTFLPLLKYGSGAMIFPRMICPRNARNQ